MNIHEQAVPGGPSRAQLFASLFLQTVPSIKNRPGHYDPDLKLYIDEETQTPMWLGSNTTCSRSSGMKNEMNTYCVSYDGEGNCTGYVDKMDFSTDYDQVSDQY